MKPLVFLNCVTVTIPKEPAGHTSDISVVQVSVTRLSFSYLGLQQMVDYCLSTGFFLIID